MTAAVRFYAVVRVRGTHPDRATALAAARDQYGAPHVVTVQSAIDWDLAQEEAQAIARDRALALRSRTLEPRRARRPVNPFGDCEEES